MNTEMKPCPFCGRTPDVECVIRDDNSYAPRPHRNYDIRCCVTMSVESDDWWSGETPPESDNDRAAKADLISTWNRRSTVSLETANELARFVKHLETCRFNISHNKHHCDCGVLNALARFEAEKGRG
jgi:hypothetical protein